MPLSYTQLERKSLAQMSPSSTQFWLQGVMPISGLCLLLTEVLLAKILKTPSRVKCLVIWRMACLPLVRITHYLIA